MSTQDNGATKLDRREALKAAALLPFAFAWELGPAQLERAVNALATTAPQSDYTPLFFTNGEWQTVRMLADYVIPRDARSGSATDALVPEYMDFLLADADTSEASRLAMRGGLAWLDFETRRRFGSNFVGAADPQRRQILDDIAWPARARPEMSQGVAFFNRFRDFVASGFFSSRMGWEDLRYVGNTFHNWTGCPVEAMAKLGVSHDLMTTRIPVQTRNGA